MVKLYYRYERKASFGVIVSPESNIAYDSSGKFLLVPALEKVSVWHVRQGVCTKTLSPSVVSSGPSLAVTSVASSPSSLIASGYADGSIRIWDCDKGTCETTLNGHKGAVSSLRYNNAGSLLASGSKDCDIILWDVVSETGLFRLRGHRDQVTDVVFLDSGKKLVTSSKDKFLRVWDLDTQHCIQIIGGHHSEIWSIDVDPAERYLVSGSGDSELRFYSVKQFSVDEKFLPFEKAAEVADNGDLPSQSKWVVLRQFGEIQRQTKYRTAVVRFNKYGNLLACQAERTVEIYSVLDEAEAKRKAKRRLHRLKEKKHEKETMEVTENGDKNDENKVIAEAKNPRITVSDVFKPLHPITIVNRKKICSISFCPITPKNSLATLALSLNNNLLELHSITHSVSTKTLAIELQGHRSGVRSVTLSSDNTLLMSTSDNAVKIWNPSSGSCLQTIDSNVGLCSLIVPHNKYALVGTKGGTIEIIDIGSGTRLEEVEAHGGHVYSIVAIPNENGFVTGSADKDVKFWEYQIKHNSGQGTNQLTLSHVRTLTMNNDVRVVAVSPDGKYIAVALSDYTVKVHFMDSFKFFLSLYGHKLPVECMDISSDGALLVTGSSDKNLKIWGLDFGDCHNSIFAHADSVMAVKFVNKTHYVFSVGKDRLVKYWDADKFELLLTLEGHHSAVSCLAVSNLGDFVVTGSQDRSICRWDRTDDQFVVDEEKEKRLTEMFESDIENAFENKYALKEEIPEEGVVATAGKRTQETLTATDSIVEKLDIAEAEMKRIAEYEEERKSGMVARFQPDSRMCGLSPSDFVLSAFSDIHSSDLEQALLALPFSDAFKLLSCLKEWTSYVDKIELICRIVTVLLQTHYNQLVTTPPARPVLSALRDTLYGSVKEWKDTFGFNLAAMDHLQQLMASRSDALFRDARTKLLEIRRRHSKRFEERSDTREEKRRKQKQK